MSATTLETSVRLILNNNSSDRGKGRFPRRSCSCINLTYTFDAVASDETRAYGLAINVCEEPARQQNIKRSKRCL
jgi:hypothetical protein